MRWIDKTTSLLWKRQKKNVCLKCSVKDNLIEIQTNNILILVLIQGNQTQSSYNSIERADSWE